MPASMSEKVSDRIHHASLEVHKGLDAVGAGIRRVGRGTAAGFLGGLVASWMMTQYQQIEAKPVKVRREELRQAYATPRPRKRAVHAVSVAHASAEEPTVKAAQKVSRKLFEHELTPVEKQISGPAVHYGYGAMVGALYGGLSELIPSVSAGLGIPYATILWLAGSETAVPALGLGKPATQVPAEKHASAMATHFVYGMTLDISRRIFRRLI